MKNLSTTPAETAKVRHLPFLDGIRAFSALWVMLGHIHLFSLGWQRSGSLWGRPLDLLLYMHLGVNIFLVLSGFCLALPVVTNGNRLRTGLKDYFLARAWRILPPYLITLWLILLINSFIPLAGWGRHPAGLTYTIPASVLLSNIFLLQDVLPSTNIINGPFWSIAVEWHLYFVFPLLVYVLRRFGTAVLLAVGAVAAVALTWLRLVHPQLSASIPVMVPEPPYYIFLFTMGAVAASLAFDSRFQGVRARLHRYAKLFGIAMCVPLCALLWKYRIVDGNNVHIFMDHLHIIDPLTGTVTAALLLVLCGLSPEQGLRRFFEMPFLVAIGGFSYSLYLVHIPILALLNHWIESTGLSGQSGGNAFFVMVSLGVPVCLLFARKFAALFERRYRPAATRTDQKAALVRENAPINR